eukprot:SAG31_NODE_155_length_22130_cov_9.540098_30_plen_225_part_00
MHGAFADLFGTDALWCSFDMAHMKPPTRGPHWDGEGFVHWDLSEEILRAGLHLRVQGELLLEDMPPDAGGFHCIPGFHTKTPAWVAAQPIGKRLEVPATLSKQMRHVEGRAGDLLIWHSFLPHGSCKNNSHRPRMMQLITMFPWDSDSTFKAGYVGEKSVSLDEERARRLAMWRERLHLASFDSVWDPSNPYFTGGFGGERRLNPSDPPILNELGEKLLGLKDW